MQTKTVFMIHYRKIFEPTIELNKTVTSLEASKNDSPPRGEVKIALVHTRRRHWP